MEHTGWVEVVAFSPDGQTALISSGNGMARLWDVGTCQARGRPLRHPGEAIVTAAFSPDGQTVLTGGGVFGCEYGTDSGTARLWEVRTGQTDPSGKADTDAGPSDVPSSALDEAERLQLSVEVRTGRYFDSLGRLIRLSVVEWELRRRRLEQLGGFCDVEDWPEKSEKN